MSKIDDDFFFKKRDILNPVIKITFLNPAFELIRTAIFLLVCSKPSQTGQYFKSP